MANNNLLVNGFDCRDCDYVCCWGSGALNFCNAGCGRAFENLVAALPYAR